MVNQLELPPPGRWRHSLNQDVIKYKRDREGKGYDRKAEKSERRKRIEAKFAQDWINRQSELNLDPKQRFNLALRRGNDTDIQLISDEINDAEKFGYRVEVVIKPADSTVDAKIA